MRAVSQRDLLFIDVATIHVGDTCFTWHALTEDFTN